MAGLALDVLADNIVPLVPLIASHLLVRPLDGKGGVTAALDPFNFSDMQIERYFTNSWK
eukprot:gene15685-2239_t